MGSKYYRGEILYYVNVIVDHSSNATDRVFTYGATEAGLKPGDAVAIPFARNRRLLTGYIHSLIPEPPAHIKGLRLVDSLKPEESLPEVAIDVAEWMQERYFCRLIDALRCFAAPGKAAAKSIKQTSGMSGDETAEGDGVIADDTEAWLLETPPIPTREQARALSRILPVIEKRQAGTFLIHGVTNSGKTEIYLRAIEASLRTGRPAIMLVPEIVLTGQTIERFYRRFGREKIAVLHSRLAAGERRRQWERIRRGEVAIAIGARSAVFAPFSELGVLIIDEEHESSYKSDMTPKYDTIEVGIELGRRHAATVLLGSATPSLTSYYKSLNGEFERLELAERYDRRPFPHMQAVDMREELQAGNRSIFSRILYESMQNCLAERQQIMLFLNRRGYSSFLSCRSCGFVVKCTECGIAMTYHKSTGEAVCHYCGRKQVWQQVCPVCQSPYLKHFGVGTEKVEETARSVFPEAAIERLDLDTTRRKGSFDAILNRFRRGKTQILIGTQMIAKGLDFTNVGLVGVISADITLNLPDYRAAERSFQLITQVAGRAGRGSQAGEVIVQTYEPDHYAVQTALAHDYRSFYQIETAVRQILDYPPFSDMIRLVLTAADEADARTGMEKIRELFLRRAGREHAAYVLGPQPAMLPRMNQKYQYQLQIKCLPQHWQVYQKVLRGIKYKTLKEREHDWQLSIDLNPFSLN